MARPRCRLADLDQCVAPRDALVISCFIDRIARPFLGLLALSDFFPTITLCFCGALRVARSRGMGRLFQGGPLALVPNLLPWPIVGQRTSSPLGRLNSIRSPTKSARSDRGCLRHCE